jgi:ribosome-binding protein aMBF1 (putative translation factor)
LHHIAHSFDDHAAREIVVRIDSSLRGELETAADAENRKLSNLFRKILADWAARRGEPMGTMMKISGNQLRAARSLLGLEQIELADKAGVGVNTIRRMEACAADPIGGNESTRAKVTSALERLGAEFTNGDQPGVRMKGRAAKRRSSRR